MIRGPCVPLPRSSRWRCCRRPWPCPHRATSCSRCLAATSNRCASRPGVPALAAAVIDNDGIVWEQAFGQQDLARLLATRTDTPFHLDGLTQLFSATLVLRCVEEGRVTLDAPIKSFSPGSPDGDATVGQILSHTSGEPGDPVFSYRPDRLAVLSAVVSTCTGVSFRRAFAAPAQSRWR